MESRIPFEGQKHQGNVVFELWSSQNAAETRLRQEIFAFFCQLESWVRDNGKETILSW